MHLKPPIEVTLSDLRGIILFKENQNDGVTRRHYILTICLAILTQYRQIEWPELLHQHRSLHSFTCTRAVTIQTVQIFQLTIHRVSKNAPIGLD